MYKKYEAVFLKLCTVAEEWERNCDDTTYSQLQLLFIYCIFEFYGVHVSKILENTVNVCGVEFLQYISIQH